MTTVALDAARAFAEMSDHAQEQEVLVTGTNLSLLDNSNVYISKDKFQEIARTLLETGRIEHYWNLDSYRRVEIINTWFSDTPVETLFLLDGLKRGVSFTKFLKNTHLSYQEFDTELLRRFDSDFKRLGSEDFRQMLHLYLITFGARREYDADTCTMTEYSGDADDYMMLTALVLRRSYGEKRVIMLLDKIIRDRYSIRAIEFINLIKSKVDYTLYPLEWSVSLI